MSAMNPSAIHMANHDVDPYVAFNTTTGQEIDFCYDCDRFITTDRIRKDWADVRASWATPAYIDPLNP